MKRGQGSREGKVGQLRQVPVSLELQTRKYEAKQQYDKILLRQAPVSLE